MCMSSSILSYIKRPGRGGSNVLANVLSGSSLVSSFFSVEHVGLKILFLVKGIKINEIQSYRDPFSCFDSGFTLVKLPSSFLSLYSVTLKDL